VSASLAGKKETMAVPFPCNEFAVTKEPGWCLLLVKPLRAEFGFWTFNSLYHKSAHV